MKPMRSCAGRVLTWTQPAALRREFVLQDDDVEVATLRFRSALGSFATADTGDGSWTFKRVGFWAPRVTACVAGTDDEIATFRNNTWSGGGTLTMGDGRALRANTNFWMSTFEFVDEAGEPLVRFRKVGGFFHLGAHVDVLPASVTLRELPWLVVLGWYVTVLMRDDAAGAGAAGAAAAG